MIAVSIPVYTVKGWFTTCAPQFLEHAAGIHLPDVEHAAGIHLPDAGSDVRTSPAGGQPFSSPYHPSVCGL